MILWGSFRFKIVSIRAAQGFMFSHGSAHPSTVKQVYFFASDKINHWHSFGFDRFWVQACVCRAVFGFSNRAMIAVDAEFRFIFHPQP